MRRSFVREEIPVALWQQLAPRVLALADKHRFTDIEGLLRSVYLQGVRDAAEALALSGAVIEWSGRERP